MYWDAAAAMKYPKYATTVIGAYSVPDWYEPLDRLVAMGQLSMAAMADAQFRATEAAVLDQEVAGIDVITGGEMHRRTNNRHSPPNAMLNYFWQKIPAFQGKLKPKPITPYDPNVYHPALTCRAPIADNIDLGLADEFKMVSALADKPVKVTMTGPHMLAKVAYDEHYNDVGKMMADLGKLLRHNFKLLAEAGCKHIQIDEPLFTLADDAEVNAAVEAINMAIEGLPRDIHTSTHVCQGNYAVGKDYDGQIGHRYFDSGRYKADLVCKIETTSYLIEHDMTDHYKGVLGNHQLGVGAVDVQDPRIESGEIVAERISKHKWLAPEQTIITSSCGFNHLPRSTAAGKLKAMTQAKRILGG
jgi:5-methyltetrahydropteroyltriglutamate--homocysteine methyltransferase